MPTHIICATSVEERQACRSTALGQPPAWQPPRPPQPQQLLLVVCWQQNSQKNSRRLWSEGRKWGAFLGRPDFQSRGPQIPIFKGFGDLWTENRGAPKTPNPTTTDLTPHLRPLMWRSRRRKSSSVPAGAANFPAAIFLAGKCPNHGRDSIWQRCRKIGE